MAGSGAFPKVTGDLIYLADYTAIYNAVVPILGVGSGTSGYGATPSSSALTGNPVINDAEWDNLRADINACRTHQTGSAFTNTELPAVNAGDVVAISGINLYKTRVDTIVTNKDTVDAGQLTLVISLGGDYQTGGGWNGTISATGRAVFASANDARNFFNAGGRFRVSATCTGGTSGTANTKDYAWKQAIDGVNYNNVAFQYGATQYRAGGTVTLISPVTLSGPSAGPTPNNYNPSNFRATAQKINDTTIDFSMLFNDASVRTAPAVDENVTALINAKLDYYKSTGAVVSPIPSSVTTTKSLGP